MPLRGTAAITAITITSGKHFLPGMVVYLQLTTLIDRFRMDIVSHDLTQTVVFCH